MKSGDLVSEDYKYIILYLNGENLFIKDINIYLC